MTRVQKSALKQRVRQNLKFYQQELKKFNTVASRHKIKREPLFQAAIGNVRKEITFFKRLSKKLK